MDLATGNIKAVYDHAEDLLKEQGVKFDPELESHRNLCLEILIKNVKLFEIDLQRRSGEYGSEAERRLLESVHPSVAILPNGYQQQQVPVVEKSERFDIVDPYKGISF